MFSVCLSFVALAASAVPSVKAGIVQRSAPAAGETILAVVVQPTELALGSYQGRVRFEPGAFTIVSVAAAPGGDASRLINAADTAKGMIQFAAYTVSGFKSQDALLLVVRPKRSLATAKLAVDLEVATDFEGKAIPASRIVPARGLSGAAGRH